MTPKERKKAGEIINTTLKHAVFYGVRDGVNGRELLLEAMQEYAEWYYETKLAKETKIKGER